MKRIRTVFYLVSVLAAGYAAFLSYQIDHTYYASGFDSAKDGAAAGFAILSGLALVAASITYLKSEK